MGRAPVLEAAAVEVVGGELADGGVHTVLHAQKLDRAARALQALKQAALQVQLAALGAPHRCRQLLRIAHQHRPGCPTKHCRRRSASIQHEQRGHAYRRAMVLLGQWWKTVLERSFLPVGRGHPGTSLVSTPQEAWA